MNITITGTRRPCPLGVHAKLEFALQPFAISENRFYIGGADGMDTRALGWLAENSDSGLSIVVPRRLQDQPKNAQMAILSADIAGVTVTELHGGPGPHAYHERNRYMVDRSEFVIGFVTKESLPNVKEHTGGTWSTLHYAQSKGLPHLIVPV